jgi:hypothetical protein
MHSNPQMGVQMRKALAALTLSVVAFVTSIFPALAQEESDLYEDAVYNIPLVFSDGVYGTTLSLSVVAILFLILFAAILALAIMGRSDEPRK